MKKLIIKRKQELNNRGRDIDVYINNSFFNKISSGQELVYETRDDFIFIKSKIDWCTSRKIKIELVENENYIEIGSSISNTSLLVIAIGVVLSFILVIVSFSKIAIASLLFFALIPVYKITIRYNEYLKIYPV